jgi:hypothetical protein
MIDNFRTPDAVVPATNSLHSEAVDSAWGRPSEQVPERFRLAPRFSDSEAPASIAQILKSGEYRPSFVIEFKGGAAEKKLVPLMNHIENSTATKIDYSAEFADGHNSRRAFITVIGTHPSTSAPAEIARAEQSSPPLQEPSTIDTSRRSSSIWEVYSAIRMDALSHCLGLPINNDSIGQIVEAASRYNTETYALTLGLPIDASRDEVREKQSQKIQEWQERPWLWVATGANGVQFGEKQNSARDQAEAATGDAIRHRRDVQIENCLATIDSDYPHRSE